MLKNPKTKFFVLCFTLLIVSLIGCNSKNSPENSISLKDECLETLIVLSNSLLNLQITDQNDPDFGAIQCPSCNVLHTRAAEAVYPFSVVYKQTDNQKYLKAAIDVGNWLIQQQLAEGEWKETPEEWTGTTTDQLLMMVLAFDIVKGELTGGERELWMSSMYRAADYLTKYMDANFASINYCTTTMATLAMMNYYFPNQTWAQKAKTLASEVASKMDKDGFICAEGDRVYGVKYGADVGYEIDMSLWGMALFARMVNDTLITTLVKNSLKNHLYFVYPDGAIDGSWGIRSNKWTTYGSQTADGCQILFSLFTREDARYRTAAIKNLEYLRGMMKDGIIGYGPHYWQLFTDLPCIYPTFVRSKNLALTVELGDQQAGITPPLPTEEIGWFHRFPTMDVVLARSKNFMMTITAYGYEDLNKRYKSKYMHRPTGGSISNLWVEGHGFLQLSSQTEYHRWEPMHFPEVGEICCITPRIEFTSEDGYFTNLYEFNGRMTVDRSGGMTAIISTTGELSDRTLLPGGVAYEWIHTLYDNFIEKSVTLRYHDGDREVRIIEPFVNQPGMTFEQIDDRTVVINGEKRIFRFEVFDGNVELEVGKDAEKYWSVFPSIDAHPVVIKIKKQPDQFNLKISYRISLIK